MTHSKEVLKSMLMRMHVASDVFYGMAQSTGVHAFIEFTGLMNEYIKICTEALEQGIDFTETSAHGAGALPMKTHEVAYLAEKLDCIYGQALRENPILMQILTKK